MEKTFDSSKLLPLLNSSDSVVRHRVTFDLIYECGVEELSKFWEMLDHDIDDDVVLVLASHLSRCRQGTHDREVYDRICSGLARFGSTKASIEVLEDVYLRIFKNLNTREIVMMDRSQKDCLLRDR